jgi:hypothetical protein
MKIWRDHTRGRTPETPHAVNLLVGAVIATVVAASLWGERGGGWRLTWVVIAAMWVVVAAANLGRARRRDREFRASHPPLE